MGHFKVIISLSFAIVVAAATQGDISGLREEFEVLRAEIHRLEKELRAKENELETEISRLKDKNSELETKVAKMATELDSSTPLTVFDCYLTDTWYDYGIIRFNGCAGTTKISMLRD